MTVKILLPDELLAWQSMDSPARCAWRGQSAQEVGQEGTSHPSPLDPKSLMGRGPEGVKWLWLEACRAGECVSQAEVQPIREKSSQSEGNPFDYAVLSPTPPFPESDFWHPEIKRMRQLTL